MGHQGRVGRAKRAGNDRLYGGAYDDKIYGGSGIDFIAGGAGADYIDGGPGADLLAGDITDVPDDYELVKRAGATGSNDDVNYASVLPAIESGDEIDGLTFHEGDQRDWYVIQTPDALKQFGASASHQAYLSLDMIDVVFDRPDMQAVFDKAEYADTRAFLFAARDTDPGEVLQVLPVEKFQGVPDYYLLHVTNVLSFRLTANDAPLSPLGRLETGDAAISISLGDDAPVIITIPRVVIPSVAKFDVTDTQAGSLSQFSIEVDGNPITPVVVAGATNASTLVSTLNAGLTGTGLTASWSSDVLTITHATDAALTAPSLTTNTGNQVDPDIEIADGLGTVVLDGLGDPVDALSNAGVDDLVKDINTAISASSLAGKVFAQKIFVATGERIVLSSTYAADLKVNLINTAAVELGFESGQTNAGLAPLMGRYKLVFSDDPDTGLGNAIDIPHTDADTDITSQDLSYRPAVIPLGDINGDGFDDFIAAVNDNLADTGSSFARIYFGNGSNDDFDLDGVAVKASAGITPVGDSNDLIVRAKSTGAADNGVTIEFEDDPSITGDNAEASYNTETRTLTIQINVGETTAAKVIEQVIADAAAADFNADFTISLDDSIETGNDGSGLIVDIPADQVTGGGITAATLKLPAPVLYPSNISTSQSFFAQPGDYAGDLYDDIAIAVTLNNGGTFGNLEQAVYILFGREHWEGEIDVFAQADVAIVSPVNGKLSVANAGDLDNDGRDDLLIGQNDKVYLFYGEATWPQGTLVFNAEFSSGDDGFASTGNPEDLWHRTNEGRSTETGHTTGFSYYFGQNESSGGDYDTGSHVVGSITSPAIDLSGANAASLSFNYFLETEGQPDQFDKVWVLVSTDNFDPAAANTIVVGSNAASITSPNINWGVAPNAIHLTDPTSGWQSASINIPDGFMTGTTRIRFLFDSIDDAENNFEGWYVDDVKVVKPLSVSDADADFAVNGFSSIAGIGNFDADEGYEDFAVLDPNDGGIGKVYIFKGSGTDYSGPFTTSSANLVFESDDLLNGYILRSVGNVISGGGNLDDFVITSQSGSYLIPGRSSTSTPILLSNELFDNSSRLLFGLGDIDGGGLDDLGAVALEESPKLGEDGSMVVHSVGQIFLGQSVWTALDFENPDLVFEPNRSTYQDPIDAELPPHFFDTAGDVNNDGKADIVLAETLGSKVHIYRGAAVSDYVAAVEGGAVTTLPVKKYVFELATPTVTEEQSGSYTGIDLNDTVAGSQNVNDAFALEGGNTDEGLSYAQNIGDFDGDGYDDLLVAGHTQSYIFLGPVEISGLTDVKNSAEYIIDSASLGRPALRMGDVNADGKSDLAFIRHDDGLEKSIITVIFGGRVLPRNLTLLSLDPIYTRMINLDDTKFIPENTNVYILNWSGGIDPITQRPYYDVVAFSSLPGETNSYGYIFSGETLKNAGTGTILDDGSAAVELQLFTSTVISTDVPVRIPQPEDTIDSWDIPIIFPIVYTFTETLTGTAADLVDGIAAYDSDSFYNSHPTGTGLTGEYYNTINLSGSVYVRRTDSTVNFTWGYGSPNASIGVDTFSARWTGYVQPRETGSYLFSTVSDDGVRLWIDLNGDGDFSDIVNGQNEFLVNSWHDQGATRHYAVNSVTLNAGQQYAIWMEYYENGGGSRAELYWRIPGSSYDQIVPTESLFSGLEGNYYNNKDLTGFELSRTDSTVNFNWGYGSPDPSVGANTFSVQWIGYIQPLYNDNYYFRTLSDDGVRVFIDRNLDGDFNDSGETIINNWTDHGQTWNYSGAISLTKGQKYPIKMEYYENGGGATARLDWARSGYYSYIPITTSSLYGLVSPGTGVFINDYETAVSTIDVSGFNNGPYGDDIISDVNVTIDLNHTYDWDADIYLVSASGTRIRLADKVGSSGDNFRKTTFDDSATTAITSGSAPFTGTFKPEQPLSTFNGQDPNGQWRLEVYDSLGYYEGSINFWSIDIQTIYTSADGVKTFNLPVSGLNGSITDVDVKLDITHPNVEDLDVSLTYAPDGAAGPITIDLFTDIGGSGNNFTNTILDANAGIPIGNAAAPFSGVFSPEGGASVLNAFDTTNANGTWTLTIKDDTTGHGGVMKLNSWELALRTDAPVYSELEVEGVAGKLTDLNVNLDISHPNVEDLDVYLISPDPDGPGALAPILIELFADVGGTGNNFSNTTLDDEALTSIDTLNAPFSGAFRPVGSLSNLDILGKTATSSFTITESLNDLIFKAKETGSAYNTITIKFQDGAIEGKASASYDALGRTLTIIVDKGETTANTVITAVNNDPAIPFTALLDRSAELENNGSGVIDWSTTVPQEVTSGGTNLNGTWTLRIADDQGNFSGQLNSWSLDMFTSPAVSEIEVSGLPDSLADVNVTLNITHPYDSDLDVYLYSPAGSAVKLFSAVGGTGDNFGTGTIDTTFDDQAPKAIDDGSVASPFTGSFKPQGKLSAFIGEDPNGTWRLEIYDTRGVELAPENQLNSWSLTLSFKPEDEEALKAAVAGDVNGDGLDDLLFATTGFEGTSSALGRGYLLLGRELPGNNGKGQVSEAIGLTSGGTPTTKASAVFAFSGDNNNIRFDAKTAGPAQNDVNIRFIDDGTVSGNDAAASYVGGTLTIWIDNRVTTAEKVVQEVENSAGAGMDTFRANFTVSLAYETIIRLERDSAGRFFDTSLGGGVFALGDLNYDGYDDFAISRAREDAGDALGGLLIFFGSADYAGRYACHINDTISIACRCIDAVITRARCELGWTATAVYDGYHIIGRGHTVLYGDGQGLGNIIINRRHGAATLDDDFHIIQCRSFKSACCRYNEKIVIACRIQCGTGRTRVGTVIRCSA
ncbi:PA14 domain-containing protein [Thermodesulfobacteriota bacterium]